MSSLVSAASEVRVFQSFGSGLRRAVDEWNPYLSQKPRSFTGFSIVFRFQPSGLFQICRHWRATDTKTAQEDLYYGLHTALVDSRELSTHLIDSQAVLNDTLASLLSWKTDLVRSSPSLFGSSLSLFPGEAIH